MNRSRVIADIYVTRRLKAITDDLIESNNTISETAEESARKVAAASRRSANSLNILTLALVLVGIAQVWVALSG